MAIAHAPLAPFLSIHDNDNYAAGKRDPLPPLFATYTDRAGARRRVQVVSASRLGRVGVTESLAHGAAPKIYVYPSQLSQFLDEPYPKRRPDVATTTRISVHPVQEQARADAATRVAAMLQDIATANCDIRRRVARAAGVPISDITGDSKFALLVHARRGILGAVAARNPNCSLSMLGRLLGTCHTTVLHHLRAIGLHERVALFDLPHLRALWRKGRMQIGYEPGQMPDEVARRLAGFVDVQHGVVEPMTWLEFRVFLGRKIAEERLAKMREQMKCAA